MKYSICLKFSAQVGKQDRFKFNFELNTNNKS